MDHLVEFNDLMPNKLEIELIKKGDIPLTLLRLKGCCLIKDIIISTNYSEVIDISNRFNSNRIKVIIRPKELASFATSTEDLIK